MGMSSGYLRDVAKNAVYAAFQEGVSQEETDMNIDDTDELWMTGCHSGDEHKIHEDYTGTPRSDIAQDRQIYCDLKKISEKYGVPNKMKWEHWTHCD
jgi:hypothetical protein